MFLIVALLLFALFAANVVMGALGGGAFMTIVGEALALLGASIAFTVAILRRETAAKRVRSDNESNLKGGLNGQEPHREA